MTSVELPRVPVVRAFGSAESIILHRVAELNRRGHEPSVWEAVTGSRWPQSGRLSARGRSYRYTVTARLLEAGELEDVAPAGSTSKRLRVPALVHELELAQLRAAQLAAERESERLHALIVSKLERDR